MPEKTDQICLKLPLFLDGRLVGRLEAIGDGRAVDANETLQLLIERSEELHAQIELLMQEEVWPASDEIVSCGAVAGEEAEHELVGAWQEPVGKRQEAVGSWQ